MTLEEAKVELEKFVKMLECSVCGSRARKYNYMASVGTKGLSYCPYCGAQMLEDVDLAQTSLFLKYPGGVR